MQSEIVPRAEGGGRGGGSFFSVHTFMFVPPPPPPSFETEQAPVNYVTCASFLFCLYLVSLFRVFFVFGQVRSYPDDEEGNVAVNFWFRNVTSFAEVENDVLGLGSPVEGVEHDGEL